MRYKLILLIVFFFGQIAAQKKSKPAVSKIESVSPIVKKVETLSNGNIQVILTDRNTKVKLQVEEFKDSLKDGMCAYYYANSKPREVVYYKLGKKDGLYKSFFDSGKPFISGYYKEDKEDGIFTYYFANGNK
jgi:antitoxin component YwqK of YwqJK toxin-antitoxin module